MTRSLLSSSLVLGCILLAASGCSSSSSSTGSSTSGSGSTSGSSGSGSGSTGGAATTIGSCTFAPGTYGATLSSGFPGTMTVNTNGTLSGTFAGGSAQVTSAWTLSGSTLSLNDTGGNLACPNSQTGVYTVAFTPDCHSFTTTAVNDPCTNNGSGPPHRKEQLNGTVWTRQ